jgi:hypothetical protein
MKIFVNFFLFTFLFLNNGIWCNTSAQKAAPSPSSTAPSTKTLPTTQKQEINLPKINYEKISKNHFEFIKQNELVVLAVGKLRFQSLT